MYLGPASYATIVPMEHHVELIKGFSVRGLWSGLCSCGVVVGDGPKPAVQLEAQQHEAEPDPPIPEAWHPGKHPTPQG